MINDMSVQFGSALGKGGHVRSAVMPLRRQAPSAVNGRGRLPHRCSSPQLAACAAALLDLHRHPAHAVEVWMEAVSTLFLQSLLVKNHVACSMVMLAHVQWVHVL